MKLERRRLTVPTPGAGHARRDWPERQSLLVRLSDSQGRAGVGEASPLPGYSPDTLDDVENALAAVSPSAIEAALAHEAPRVALAAAAALLPASLPAARFALETAALDWLGQQRHVSAPRLLGAAPGASRRLCALIGNAADHELLERASSALDAGYACLKLKLGAPGALERELQQLEALRKSLGDQIELRLDANGNWTTDELERAWPRLAAVGVELFEEPGPASLPAELPLGLDESLQGLDVGAAEAQVQRVAPRALVLKPTALGGVEHCWRLAEGARETAAIVSHCFDGPFAWRAAAALALCLPDSGAHGLAPHVGLAGWQPRADGCVVRGVLEIWSGSGLGLDGGFD